MVLLKDILLKLKDVALTAVTSTGLNPLDVKVGEGKGVKAEALKENYLAPVKELFKNLPATDSGYNSALLGIGAGIAMVGAIGTGIGQGYAVGRGLEAIARNPELFNRLRATLLLGLAITESSAIYCLVVSIILIFK